MKTTKKISVVIPVYGCRGALVELCERLNKSLKKITDSYEIILVNDGCPQNSWESIVEICKDDKRVKGIELSRNFGQMKAILAGLDNATGDYVVVMDCDLQDRPEEIENLYKKLEEGYDVVFAKRVSRKDKKRKIFIAKLFYKIYGLAAGVKYDPELCNFSIMRRNVVDAYCSMREEHRAFVMYVQWLGFKQATLPVEHSERKEGKSSYSLRRRIKLATEILLSQSDKFLKFIAIAGLIISLLSFIAIIAIIIVHLFIYPQLSGWVSTICMICLMSGLNIFVVGIAGLYIGKIFIQVKERPLYIIRTTLNEEEKK
ncbi:glycosyltransferase family 2 protein [Candidatus Saccharibacteria bacterium]|nr:glycosyltransferase family 2 protein [Candidatus Saccharibacteria bacterium]